MLLFFDKISLSQFILYMLEEAVRLYKISSPQPAQQQNLHEIEKALAKLSEDDLSVYFTRCLKGDLDFFENKFERIFESNYPFLTQKLTEKVILAVTKMNDHFNGHFCRDDAPYLASILVSNKELLNRLSQKGLVTLLKRLPIRDIQ